MVHRSRVQVPSALQVPDQEHFRSLMRSPSTVDRWCWIGRGAIRLSSGRLVAGGWHHAGSGTAQWDHIRPAQRRSISARCPTCGACPRSLPSADRSACTRHDDRRPRHARRARAGPRAPPTPADTFPSGCQEPQPDRGERPHTPIRSDDYGENLYGPGRLASPLTQRLRSRSASKANSRITEVAIPSSSPAMSS